MRRASLTHTRNVAKPLGLPGVAENEIAGHVGRYQTISRHCEFQYDREPGQCDVRGDLALELGCKLFDPAGSAWAFPVSERLTVTADQTNLTGGEIARCSERDRRANPRIQLIRCLYVFGAVTTMILNPTVPDEADALPRLQRAVPRHDDRSEMDEQDFTVVGGDPTVTLFLFEPANRSEPPHPE